MTNLSPGVEPILKDPLWGDLALSWKWMLGLGILMAVLGVIGLGMTYALTIVSVLWFGVLAAIGGVAQVIDAFKCKGWRSFFAHLLLGLLYIAAGIVMVALPIQSAWWLTLLIGAALIVTGVLRLVMAFQMKGTSSALFVGLMGLISLALGVIILTIVDLPTPEQAASPEAMTAWFGAWGWLIGMFVAIEFISQGAALIALAFAARGSRSSVPPAGPHTAPAR